MTDSRSCSTSNSVSILSCHWICIVQWSQRSCKSCIFVAVLYFPVFRLCSCIFLYLRLLLITDYLSTNLSCCLPMGQTWTPQSRIWSTKNWPTVVFLWWLTSGRAICRKCTVHLQNVSLLLEYCRDTIMPNKCSEIGFWSPVRCPVFFQMSCKMSCIFSDCAGVADTGVTRQKAVRCHHVVTVASRALSL